LVIVSKGRGEQDAAMPPHSAVRLRLTVSARQSFLRLRLEKMEAWPPNPGRSMGRKGGAFPHCAAAKPRLLLRVQTENLHGFSESG